MIAAFCVAALLPDAAPAQTPSPGQAPRRKAIVYRSYGSPDVLRLEEIEKPVPDDNQVLVRVRAVSLNPLDWHYMRGTPYFARAEMGLRNPKVTRLGVDFAGTVESVGRSVTRFKPGDDVFGGRTGALAEYVTVREDRAIALKPANVTFEQAAAVPIAAITALQGLRDKGNLQPGQKVLINGASGGVGTFAVQIAKSFGADVTGVCSTRNVEMVRSIGADRVIDYTREDFTQGEQRYDLILDNVGNRSLRETLRALNPRGKYVMVGGPTGRWIAPMPRAFRALVLSRFVTQDMSMMLAELNQNDLNVLRDLMQAGKVKPVVDRRYRLSDVSEALRYLEQGHARGKVVVTLEPGSDATPVRASLPANPESAAGSDLVVLALVALAVLLPIVAALALNRRFQRRNRGKRPYRWGYYVAIQSFIAGLGLAALVEPGAGVVIVCGVVYAVLAWFFALRHHWAWIALTILSLNPVAWIINFIYLRKRWAEDSPAATPTL
ncbi:MAG TPA: NAD(P)-dependent alcohol dehydrogenase [Anaeromyxobacter sp.]